MNTDRFALHRPDLISSLVRGQEKLIHLMSDSAQSMPAGKVLIRADTEHDYVYRLKSGWACRKRAVPDGREQLILVFLPGDLFAIKSIFLTRQPDSIQILSDAVVERLHCVTLRSAYSRDVDLTHRCMWQLVEEERRLHGWVFGLGQGSAEERLALLLVDLRGRLALAGTIAEGALTFELPLTQVQIAEHLGITSVHVNRTLKSFREKGIAVFRNGDVTIKNLAGLRQIAEPLLDAYERTALQYGLPNHGSST